MRLGLLLLFAFTSTAAAQEVRVKREVAKYWLTGEVVTRGSDSLIVILHEAAAPDTVLMHNFALVEVYRGRKVSPPRVVFCTLGGMFLGGFVGWLATRSQTGDFEGLEVGLYGIGIGTVVGLAVGLIPQPSWKLVYASPEGRQWIDDRRPWPTQ